MRPLHNPAAIGWATVLYATVASALASFSEAGDSSDIHFRWGVPKSVASSGSGNVYFQIDASDSYGWVGLGIGTGMKDARIFLIYQDGEGNVTLSPRDGKYHVMPTYNDQPDVELLAGSGVSNGKMTANIRCGDCDNLDKKGKTDWISAWFNGDPINSNNPEAIINFHGDNSKTLFNVDLAQASMATDDNPFLSERHESGDNGATTVVASGDDYDSVRLAHGVIMTIVFVGLYPLGALLMPVFGKWFFHSMSQILAYILMWGGVTLGIIYANHINFLGKQEHTRLGLIVVCLMGFQPVLGFFHHRQYNKANPIKWIGTVHVWFGRILMILGIVNGGLGLRLTGKTGGGWVIAYSIIAGLMVILYTVSMVYSRVKKRQRMRRKSSTSQLAPEPPAAELEGSGDVLLEPWGDWQQQVRTHVSGPYREPEPPKMYYELPAPFTQMYDEKRGWTTVGYS